MSYCAIFYINYLCRPEKILTTSLQVNGSLSGMVLRVFFFFFLFPSSPLTLKYTVQSPGIETITERQQDIFYVPRMLSLPSLQVTKCIHSHSSEMTQILPFISFRGNLQLNAVLQNRNLARVYHRSLEGCQASHLVSTFCMIIRL